MSVKFLKFVRTAVVALVLLALVSCEKMLPEAFRKEDSEHISLSSLDEKACGWLIRETGVFADSVAIADLEEPADSVWASMVDSLIGVLLDTMDVDTCLIMENPALEDTVYAVFVQVPGSPPETVFYISWELNSDNADGYAMITLFDRAGEVVRFLSMAMDLATIAGCTETVTWGGQDVALPKIRSRWMYSLPEGMYLVRLILSEPATIGTFRMVVLSGSG